MKDELTKNENTDDIEELTEDKRIAFAKDIFDLIRGLIDDERKNEEDD